MKHKAAIISLAAGAGCIVLVSLAFRWYAKPASDVEVTEDPSVTLAGTASSSSSPSPMRVTSCGGAPNGARCGKAEGMRCVFDACIENVCGDAIVLGGEKCDDGNEEDGDGCSADCTWEPLPKCGNGKLDAPEECDDGNSTDSDQCTRRCTVARCGDGAKTPTEACDDGNLDDTDRCTVQCKPPDPKEVRVGARLNPDGTVSVIPSGIAGSGAGSAEVAQGGAAGDARSGSAGAAGTGTTASGSSQAVKRTPTGVSPFDEEACEACKAKECRNFHEIDLIAGCYDSVNGNYGAAASDGKFLNECAALVECSHINECFRDARKLGAGCYCGSTELDDCLYNGPARDAACVAEWVAAARTSNHEEIMHRMSDFAFPSAWAFFLLECEAKNCRSVCEEGSGA